MSFSPPMSTINHTVSHGLLRQKGKVTGIPQFHYHFHANSWVSRKDNSWVSPHTKKNYSLQYFSICQSKYIGRFTSRERGERNGKGSSRPYSGCAKLMACGKGRWSQVAFCLFLFFNIFYFFILSLKTKLCVLKWLHGYYFI